MLDLQRRHHHRIAFECERGGSARIGPNWRCFYAAKIHSSSVRSCAVAGSHYSVTHATRSTNAGKRSTRDDSSRSAENPDAGCRSESSNTGRVAEGADSAAIAKGSNAGRESADDDAADAGWRTRCIFASASHHSAHTMATRGGNSCHTAHADFSPGVHATFRAAGDGSCNTWCSHVACERIFSFVAGARAGR